MNQFGDNQIVMQVEDRGNNIFNWNIKVFEKVEGAVYKLNEDNIKEASFELSKIKDALHDYFEVLETINFDGTEVTDSSTRVYLVCRKK